MGTLNGDDLQAATPAEIRRLLKAAGLRPRHSLGQNFLAHPPTVANILAAAEPKREDLVLEIGPGLGVLTEQLLERAGRVVAVELDKQLAQRVSQTLAGKGDLVMVEGDATKVDISSLWRDWAGPRKVVANLPYYATTAILLQLLKPPLLFERAVLMVQREVAERMQAPPGTKTYGSLSVLVQYWCEASIVANVPPSAFVPAPKVQSAVISLRPRPEPAVQVPAERFFPVVRAGFSQRRKTLRNALSAGLQVSTETAEAALVEAGIDPGRRAETLSMSEFAAVATAFGNNARTKGNG